MATERKEFDIIIIGSGAGLTGIAMPAAENGFKVCLVERADLGGTCLNRGCIPSKMLAYPAQVACQIGECKSRYHLDVKKPHTIHSEMMKELDDFVEHACKSWKEKIKDKGIHLIQDEVIFVDKKVLKTKKSKEEITAPKIFIACGSRPAPAPFNGLNETPFITHIEGLFLKKQPKSLIILGGGYIGAELALIFHQTGVEVTVFDSKANLADREDEEIAEEFMEVFCSTIKVVPNAKITKVSYEDEMFVLEHEHDQNMHKQMSEQLIVVTGFQSNADQLEVENSGILLTDSGFIKVDECLQTTCEGVWALGDCVGNYLFRHTANFEAEYLLTHAALVENPEPIEYPPVPHAIISCPEIGSVGYNEQDLREKGIPYVRGMAKYTDTPFGRALRAERGFAKVLIHKESRKILGFHVIGETASEVVHEVIPVITMGGKLDDILKCIHIHPTLNEVVRETFRSAKEELIRQNVDIPFNIRYK